MSFKIEYGLLVLILLFCVHPIVSQQKEFKGDPDSAFEIARELAFNSQRAKAQDTLLLILSKYPNYHDIRAFLGSTYSWDGKYKLARKAFTYVLERDAKRKDTWIAAVNNELWAEQPFKALDVAMEALSHFPMDLDILYKKAIAEESADKLEYALMTTNAILEIDPNNEKAINYKIDLVNKLSYNVVGINSTVSFYSEIFDPAQYYGIKYGRRTKHVSILAKVNYSRRFETDGIQFELDLYPKIADGFYAYTNIGYSNTSLFPEWRVGAELHKSLPKSFEISAGFRALKFQETTTIYTGSLTWYTGNSYWSFRPYFTPGDSGVSKSGTLNYRKYRSDADNYLSLDVGMGFSPEFFEFNSANDGTKDIVELNSQKVNFGYYFTSKNKLNAWGIQVGAIHQEISFDPGNYFWLYSAGLTWDLKFR